MLSHLRPFTRLCLLALAVALTGLMPSCTKPLPFNPGLPSNAPTPAVTAVAQRRLIPTPTIEPARAATTTASQLSPEQVKLLAKLPSQGIAPELQNETWLNSAPLTLAELRGKVVIVEFWTFDCINCRNVIPYVRAWHEKYQADGLVIIGVHTPEFAYERELTNVQSAIAQLGVTWPVAIDNEKLTWRAYANRYWPAAYLIDKTGNIRHLAIGEGRYEYTEAVIQALLAEPT